MNFDEIVKIVSSQAGPAMFSLISGRAGSRNVKTYMGQAQAEFFSFTPGCTVPGSANSDTCRPLSDPPGNDPNRGTFKKLALIF